MSDNREYIVHPGESGSINISEDVVASIAASAAKETEGVASLTSSVGKEISELLGKKSVPRGVKISFEDEAVTADVCITVDYGTPMEGVGKAVQKNVAAAIEGMTGFTVAAVNVHICGIALQ